MRLNLVARALAAAATAQAAPSLFTIDPAASANQIAFGSSLQSATLTWTGRIANAISHTLGLAANKAASSYDLPDADEDKTILDIINSSDEFRQLAHVLNYSSPAIKQLLSSNDRKLTFFAPVNWHKEHDHHDHHDHDDDLKAAGLPELSQGHASVQHWRMIEQQIASYERDVRAGNHDSDDDDEKKRKREIIRHLIDSEALYHLVRSEEPLDAKNLADNSSVATHLNTGTAHKYNDGTDWRIRTGKSLLPVPAIYLNLYSRVVKPDIKAQNGLIHAIKYPLVLPPDVLQSLFFGQTTFSTSTSGLQKVHAAKYLAYRPYHHSGPHSHQDDEDGAHHRLHHGGDGKGNDTFPGVPAETIFVPTNLAWTKLPFSFRAYLFSPWGYHLLQKVFMLHSLPADIVYADFVHHVHHEHEGDQARRAAAPRPTTTVSLSGDLIKTSYTFDSVLPALDGSEGKFETVDVDVYRYYLLPGGKGPLQTRVVVQGVPVVLQDIPAANGVFHAIDAFIKPKGHPHKGLWAEIAREAEVKGFGSVDLEAEARSAAW
ncbi:hypothetical protein ACQY0O_001892 [Thecaphora frezii]